MTFNSSGDIVTVISHRTNLRRRAVLLALSVIFTFSLASCGTDELRGRLVLSGSSTLTPLATKAVTLWKKDHPHVETRIEPIGSDAGLERLVRYSDADLALVSRPLDEGDRSAALTAGKRLVILPVAWDAVCLVVPVSNTWCQSLTAAQAARAFTTAELWSDLDPAWPGTPIHRFALGPNSGTADVFAGTILGGHKDGLYGAASVQASEDDKILARGVAQVDGAIGFLGWTTVQEMDKGLRVVAFAGIPPTEKSIQDRTYGIPRQLWLVAAKETLGPATRSFVQFLFDHYGSLAEGTGLVPLADSERLTVETSLKSDF